MLLYNDDLFVVEYEPPNTGIPRKIEPRLVKKFEQVKKEDNQDSVISLRNDDNDSDSLERMPMDQ
ncbi:unnamed protein product [Ceratitis capitata]|uniref:(Mediterranean fruit fly) hypothetical protein n=1 Tax=Ceratitis capitata TaxID=7213 RepID=A0A811UBJ0_CERCA|nr:unnamed protein product [Ceratitis capitata]